MASRIIREFDYSKSKARVGGGRGRGILGLKEFGTCRKPHGLNSSSSNDSKPALQLDSRNEPCKYKWNAQC